MTFVPLSPSTACPRDMGMCLTVPEIVDYVTGSRAWRLDHAVLKTTESVQQGCQGCKLIKIQFLLR
jgi:hypothetical protein